MNEAKNYKKQVLDGHYTIKSNEPEELIAASTDLVDTLMRDIVDKNPYIDHKKAAVLAALRVASKLVHLEFEFDKTKQKEQELVQQLDGELTKCTSVI